MQGAASGKIAANVLCVCVCVQCLSVCRFDAGVVVIAIVGHLTEHVLASVFIFLRPLRLLR